MVPVASACTVRVPGRAQHLPAGEFSITSAWYVPSVKRGDCHSRRPDGPAVSQNPVMGRAGEDECCAVDWDRAERWGIEKVSSRGVEF